MYSQTLSVCKFQWSLNVRLEKQKAYFFRWDSLTMYDGGSSTSPMVGKYCGDLIPLSYVSSSNDVFIDFQSDGSETGAGFKIEYNPTGI